MATVDQSAQVQLIWALRPKPKLRQTLWRLAKAKPLGALSAVLILLLIVVAALAPVIAPYDPIAVHGGDSLLRPGGKYLLGTDELGRDVLSQIVYGARISLLVGFIAVVSGTMVGAVVGLISAYFTRADVIIQRVVDAFMAFPGLILILIVIAVMGRGLVNVMLAIGLIIAPSESRVVRGATLTVKQNVFVDAARSIGASDFRIIWRHIVPNVTAPVLIMASVMLGDAILLEASLSFLGLGAPPPNPSWGGMLSRSGRANMEMGPWLAVVPGVAISIAVLALNLFGDALRDVWDPRLRGSF